LARKVRSAIRTTSTKKRALGRVMTLCGLAVASIAPTFWLSGSGPDLIVVVSVFTGAFRRRPGRLCLLRDSGRDALTLDRAYRLRPAPPRLQHHHPAFQYREALAHDAVATLRTLRRRRLCRHSAWHRAVARYRSTSLR